MSGYILCQTKKAEKPYFIENISTNIYTIEELCYYLYNNLYLIDQTIINEGLCTWLAEELELSGLAQKLRPHLGKFAAAEDILYPIFKEINYLTYEELRTLNSRIQKLGEEPPAIRRKQKGDALVENGMYVNAIHVYQELLVQEDLESIRADLRAAVLHNLGCAYSYLFQMEKAADCFLEEWKQSFSEEAMKTYLLAYAGCHTQEEYSRRVEELEAGEEVLKAVKDTLAQFSELPREDIPSEKMDQELTRLTREYHRSTGS